MKARRKSAIVIKFAWRGDKGRDYSEVASGALDISTTKPNVLPKDKIFKSQTLNHFASV